MKNTFSRRQLLTSLGGAAMFSRFGAVNAFAQGSGYKALVCIYWNGGNDGHNTVIPMATAEYNAYKNIRGGLALPDNNGPALAVTSTDGTPYGLNNGLTAIHPLWAQGKLAVMANVGLLVQPTTRAQYLASAVPVPTNLFSHSDQTQQMHSGFPNPSGGTGWAGRTADAVAAINGAATFPAAMSMAGPALFTTPGVVSSASLIPGVGMTMWGMSFWPQSAADARKAGLQQILNLDSGLTLVQAANKVRKDALDLDAMLKSLSSTPLTTAFPGTSIGNQLKQVAEIIQLRSNTGMSRQVFFCNLGGFDTHGSQGWQQWNLLRETAEAMSAFYNATVEMGVAGNVTSFTLSEFGRTLQPSGLGSDHGWGNHHLIMGGAVQGGKLYGSFPVMALSGPDDSGNRGAMIPSTSLDQFGATLAAWFGVPAAQLGTVFPNLGNFAVQNLGFLA